MSAGRAAGTRILGGVDHTQPPDPASSALGIIRSMAPFFLHVAPYPDGSCCSCGETLEPMRWSRCLHCGGQCCDACQYDPLGCP